MTAKDNSRPPSFPDACRLFKLHLLDFRVVLSIVAVKAAKMMRVSNLAWGKAVLLDLWATKNGHLNCHMTYKSSNRSSSHLCQTALLHLKLLTAWETKLFLYSLVQNNLPLINYYHHTLQSPLTWGAEKSTSPNRDRNKHCPLMHKCFNYTLVHELVSGSPSQTSISWQAGDKDLTILHTTFTTTIHLTHQFQNWFLPKNTLGSYVYTFRSISIIYKARKTHSA